MRALFLVLLLANAAFFAWVRYYSPAEGSSDPAPLTRQIEPEKLKIVGPGEPVSSAAPRPTAVPAAITGSASTGAGAGACVEWGSFTAAEAARAEKAIEPLVLGTRLLIRRTDEGAGWWVFIPPQESRQGALKKTAELKALGIGDYFVVQDQSPLRWAISLGVFRTEEAAQGHLEAVRARGVRTAQIGMRDTPTSRIWLKIKGVDAPLQARLKELASAVEGSAVRDCTPG